MRRKYTTLKMCLEQRSKKKKRRRRRSQDSCKVASGWPLCAMVLSFFLTEMVCVYRGKDTSLKDEIEQISMSRSGFDCL